MSAEGDLRNAADLHEVIGGEPNYAKVIGHLETHSIRWANESPLVAMSIVKSQVPSICLVATKDRVRADASAVSIQLDDGDIVEWSADGRHPVGSLWLLPAVEETMRINGEIIRTADGVTIAVGEMYMHCAKSLKRSRLWTHPFQTTGVLSEAEFLRASPFAFLATVDSMGRADLSPRGDPIGDFCRLSDDGAELIIPDRPGNKLADSMHNLLSNPNGSIMFLVPGSCRVLEIKGKVNISTNLRHRETTTVNGRMPKVVLALSIESTRFDESTALVASRVWDSSTYVAKGTRPSFGRIVADQIFGEKSSEAEAAAGSFEEMTRKDYNDNMY
jgi:predicted pyridoxine 5'-phosphate oxidase superfamily flavin-nucleotide-binding protein